MRCPYCQASTRVIDKRDGPEYTRRRRECAKCGRRFTTYERAELGALFVIKKDGRREPFERSKLKAGIIKACQKRPISTKKIDEIVDSIEMRLRRKYPTEVRSKVIGELVMSKLKSLDKIAYIRFASVYRNFKDIGSFEKELKALKRRCLDGRTK